MMVNDMKAMFIGAHIDECEYGCGGISCLLADRGVELMYLNPATFLHDPPADDVRATATSQSDEAARILGVTTKKLWDNEERALTWMCSQEHMLRLQTEIEEFSPDVLFMQWPKDNHPEHAEVARASYLALSNAACHIRIQEAYAYEAGPDQTMQFFKPHFAVDFTSAADRVERSLRTFNQHRANGDGLWNEKRICAEFRGHMFGCRYAECFRIVKFPERGNDFAVRELLDGAFRWAGRMQYPAFGCDYFI